jgi:signal transduction histidine kinase
MNSEERDSRVLVVAPIGRDGNLLSDFFSANGIASAVCPSVESALDQASCGAGGLVVAEEALTVKAAESLREFRHAQPTWSDIPVLVLTAHRESANRHSWSRWLDVVGSVTLLERPMSKGPLLTAVQSALQARRRQYEAREQLAELARIGAELKTANSRKDELLGLVSHELRTPLTTVLGCAHILTTQERRLNPEEKTQVLADLGEHATRLQRVIENMLVLSRAETRDEVDPEPLLLQRVLPKLVTELTPLRGGRNLTLKMENDLPPVLANPVFLEQILRNLVRNSEKYAAERRPVQLEAKHVNGTVGISVADHGAILEPAQVHQMFELFYRDPAQARRASGLGLGLPVCKRLTEILGGSIEAHPRAGGGLCVTVSMPVAVDQTEDALNLVNA